MLFDFAPPVESAYVVVTRLFMQLRRALSPPSPANPLRLLLASTVLLSCQYSRSSNPPTPEPAGEGEKIRTSPSTRRGAANAPDLREPVVLIDGATELARLREEDTLSFPELLGLSGDAAAAPLSMFALPSNTAGVTGNTSARPVRACKDGTLPRWFDEPDTQFELVGVSNRLDQRDIRPGSCGEVRFVFRMLDPGGTRLPIAFAVVFEQPSDGAACQNVARSWMREADEDVMTLLEDAGPLSTRALEGRLTRVELNGRSRDDLDGRACNQMGVFVPEATQTASPRFVPALLDFSPGWPMYNVGSRSRIGDWLTEPGTREKVVDGVIPDGFPSLSSKDRDTRSVQWWFTLDGGRPPFDPRAPEIANAVGEFSSVMRPRHFPAEQLPEGYPTVAAYEHRLDGMTCTGCHARRSIGGFHLPGSGGSAGLVQSRSPHLEAQLEWRVEYVRAVASGAAPERTRPLHNAPVRGVQGTHCSTPDSPIAELSCEPELRCVATPDSDFGTCWPGGQSAGAPCTETARACTPPSAWFPGGHKQGGSHDIALPVAADLRACEGSTAPWECAEARATPRSLTPCSDAHCRDGYACIDAAGSAVCAPVASLKEFRAWGRRPQPK